MCLIAWNWQPRSATPLLLLANRDEFYARPTMPLHWWEDSGSGSDILAGKDLQAGGTWLGLSRSGRLAALTNYRSTEPMRLSAPSRGELVASFLASQASAVDFLLLLANHCGDYNPFNLLVYDGQQLMGLESRSATVLIKPHGIGAVSNADFHTPWPKLRQLRSRLQEQSDHAVTDLRRFLPLLHDRTVAPDAQLPDTGVPLELERMLSATFIVAPGYGTRSCSAIAIHTTHAEFIEQSFGPQGLIAENHQQLQF